MVCNGKKLIFLRNSTNERKKMTRSRRERTRNVEGKEDKYESKVNQKGNCSECIQEILALMPSETSNSRKLFDTPSVNFVFWAYGEYKAADNSGHLRNTSRQRTDISECFFDR